MSKKKMPVLRGRNAEVMLALRAGPMTLEQMTERFGSASTASTLIGYGLVSYKSDRVLGSAYSLTEQGRALCPSRRELYATAESFIAAEEARKKGWESSGRKALAREGMAA